MDYRAGRHNHDEQDECGHICPMYLLYEGEKMFPYVDTRLAYQEGLLKPPFLVYFPNVGQGQDILYLWSFTEELAAELAQQGGRRLIVMDNR